MKGPAIDGDVNKNLQEKGRTIQKKSVNCKTKQKGVRDPSAGKTIVLYGKKQTGMKRHRPMIPLQRAN